MPRRALVATVLVTTSVAASLALRAGDARAAGPATSAKKRCISSAETGQTLRAEGKLLDARASFAQCTAAECPAPVRKDCGHWVEELDAASPSFSIRLEDPAGHEVDAGQITVDGKPRAPSDRGRATPTDPGTHVFEWVRPEGSVRAEVVLHEGEHNKIVLLKAPPVPGQGGAAGEDGEVAAGDGTAGANGTSGAGSASLRPASNLPWIVSGGIALASAGVGFVLWGLGSHEHSTLQDGCATTHSCSSGDVDSSRDKLIVGDVLVGVGIVAAASAVYFFVKSRSDRGHTSTASLPLVTPGGVGIQF